MGTVGGRERSRGEISRTAIRLTRTMSGRKSSISLNCSLPIPTSTMTTPNTPNTPDILNAIINISSHHLEKLTANEIELKTEETNENDQVPPYPCDSSPARDINRYHSQFIREGLKLKVKQKIKEESIQTSDTSYPFDDTLNYGEAKLTIEDEERRERRRERNKIAATKCRNKKKERTTRLIAEGEVLEIQNSSLKEELRKLVAEKRSLKDLLNQHNKVCAKKRRLDSDRYPTKVHPNPDPKERQFECQRSNLDFNGSNLEPLQDYNYNHGLKVDDPESYIKEETDSCTDYYSPPGYFQYDYYSALPSSCQPGYSQNICMAL